MNGKNKCRILKQIRRTIADENDIPYVTRECTYQGECKGTCPRCEAELRYLEEQLEKRRRLGKKVAVAAVAASLTLSMTGCDWPFRGGSQQLEGDVPFDPTKAPTEVLDGEIAPATDEICLPTTETIAQQTQSVTEETETPTDEELLGDVAPIEIGEGSGN